MLGASPDSSLHTLPEALVLIGQHERVIAVDAAFCRALQVDPADLVGASPALLVGESAYQDSVRPALQRSFAGERATHQLMLSHPHLGPRQVSVTYHLCVGGGEGAAYCAMSLRDVTSEKLANDSFVLYSQWREALNAIDRASLGDQSLTIIAAIALERLRYLTPYRRAWVDVVEELAKAAGLDTQAGGPHAGLHVMALMPAGTTLPEGEALEGQPPTRLRLQMQGEYIGDLVVQAPDGQLFSPSQVEMMRELANRLERALHKALVQGAAQESGLVQDGPPSSACGTASIVAQKCAIWSASFGRARAYCVCPKPCKSNVGCYL